MSFMFYELYCILWYKRIDKPAELTTRLALAFVCSVCKVKVTEYQVKVLHIFINRLRELGTQTDLVKSHT